MDLFRYSVESAAQEITDLTLGTAAYFSLDGTATELALSTGEDYQGSHWIDSTQENGLGIMNPTLTPLLRTQKILLLQNAFWAI